MPNQPQLKAVAIQPVLPMRYAFIGSTGQLKQCPWIIPVKYYCVGPYILFQK